MSSTSISVLILGVIGGIVGLLLLSGKVRLVINYPESEKPSVWPEEPEEEENAPVANYVKPLEAVKPPTLVSDAPKRRRGRPRKETPHLSDLR